MHSWASCNEAGCLEAARARNGVVLLRNNSRLEVPPKAFTAFEWDELLDAVGGPIGLDWILPAFPMVTGIPVTREELLEFHKGISQGRFEYVNLPVIDEG